MKPLTNEEKDILRNVKKFNEEHGAQGWGLRNREIKDFSVQGLKLHKSTFRNVTLLFSSFTECEFIDVRFVNCKFHDSDLSRSRFVRCTFDECEMTMMVMQNSEYIDCTFDDIRPPQRSAGRVSMSSSRFTNCIFKNSTLDGFNMEGSTLTDVRFVKSTLRQVGIGNNSKIQNLNIKNCKIDKIGIGGELENIDLENCNGSGLGIGGNVSNVKIVKFKDFTHVSLAGPNTKFNNVAISDCNKLRGLTFHESHISNLQIKNCIEMSMEWYESIFEGINIIQDSSITSVMFKWGNTVKNLTIKNCTFDQRFILTETKFENLKLENVKYLPEFKVKKHEQVEYINSDRFPEK